MNLTRTIHGALAALLALIMSCVAVSAETDIGFSIEAQALDEALLEFAQQANVSVLIPGGAFSAIQANALAGDYSIEEGLEILLRGTGVRGAIASGSRQIVLEALPEQGLTQANPNRIPAMLPDEEAEGGDGDRRNRAGLELEEIVVTAQRREEALLDTPVTVTAVRGTVIEEQNIRSLEGLTSLVPGMEIEPDGQRTTIRVRGLGTSDGAPGAENITALHVDNVYISHRNNLQGYFYDIDQIEVLQGPQGTLYGRNTAAGAINIRTTRPYQGQEAAVEVELGKHAHRRLFGMFNTPISSDLALRGAFQSSARDGYFSSGIDENEDVYGRLSALWEPGERISIYGKLDFGEAWRRGNGQALLGSVDTSNPDHWRVNWREDSHWFNDRIFHPEDSMVDEIGQSRYESEYLSVVAEATLDLGADTQAILNLARIQEETRFSMVSTDGQIGASYGADVWGGLPGERVRGGPWLEETVDFRLQGKAADQFDWTAGYFYWQDDTNEPSNNPDGVALHAPVSLADSYAYYGQVTWVPPAMDRLRLTLGARHTKDWKRWDLRVNNFNSVTVGGSRGERHWSNDDVKLGIAYEAGGGLLYWNYSTGYRAGSWFPGPFPNYNPEYVDAWEFGWKGRLLDERLEMQFSTYFYNFKNAAIQFSALNTLSGEQELSIANLGNSEISGWNLNGRYLLSRNHRIDFNFDFTRAEIVDFDFDAVRNRLLPDYELGTAFDWQGLQMPNTTPWRLTLAWTQDMAIGAGRVSSRLQGVWNASRYFSYRDDTQVQYRFPGYRIPRYLALDWNLTYQPSGADWDAGFYIKNIMDERIMSSISDGLQIPDAGGTVEPNDVPNGDDALLTGSLRPPRTFGLRLGYRF